MTTNNDLLHIEAVRERGFILYAKDGELRAKKAPNNHTNLSRWKVCIT